MPKVYGGIRYRICQRLGHKPVTVEEGRMPRCARCHHVLMVTGDKVIPAPPSFQPFS